MFMEPKYFLASDESRLKLNVKVDAKILNHTECAINTAYVIQKRHPIIIGVEHVIKNNVAYFASVTQLIIVFRELT